MNSKQKLTLFILERFDRVLDLAADLWALRLL